MVMFTEFTLYLLLICLALRVNSEIEILTQGIDNISPDDIALIFFITVKNICKDDLDISVNMLQCCETITADEVDCNTINLIGGDMGLLPSNAIKNLTLIYPNLYLYNRRGICSIEVIYRNQLKKREISTDIHFDTTKFCPERRNPCETADLDFQQNCNPVDCLIKYSGTRSYFNPECKSCQKVPVCNSKIEGNENPDVAYSPYNNECGDLTITISKQDLQDMERSSTDNEITMLNAICHYGTVTSNGECNCSQGWVSATSDEGMYHPGVAQRHLCNIEIGDWHCMNKSRIRLTSIIIAILAITIISKILLIMCIMTWCYRHFTKTDKSCARELLTPTDSTVLCDEVNAFDKCYCGEITEPIPPKPKKPIQLHSQTVNITYLPCVRSSGLSTITSSDTSSGNYSVNLSNTTTSEEISFPEEDTTEDTESRKELLLHDKNIAYGIFCNADGECESKSSNKTI